MPYPRRLDNIDSVRGLAAVLVMLQHSLESSGLESLAQPGFGVAWLNLGQVGVIAFFLVSGFVIPLSLERWNSLSRFWISRVFRIYPIYIVAFVASCVLAMTPPSVKSLIAHTFFAQEYVHVENMVPASWTLSLEFFWYLTFSALFLFRLNHSMVVISSLTVLALLVATLSTQLGVRIPAGRIGIMATCAIGLIGYRLFEGAVPRTAAHAAIGAIVICCIAAFFVNFYVHPSDMPVSLSFRCVMLSWGLAYLLFYLSFTRAASRIFTLPVLSYLGTISYSIYILHPFAIRLVEHFDLRGIPTIVAVFVLTIPCAAVTYKLIERPAINYAHKLHLRRERDVPKAAGDIG